MTAALMPANLRPIVVAMPTEQVQLAIVTGLVTVLLALISTVGRSHTARRRAHDQADDD